MKPPRTCKLSIIHLVRKKTRSETFVLYKRTRSSKWAVKPNAGRLAPGEHCPLRALHIPRREGFSIVVHQMSSHGGVRQGPTDTTVWVHKDINASSIRIKISIYHHDNTREKKIEKRVNPKTNLLQWLHCSVLWFLCPLYIVKRFGITLYFNCSTRIYNKFNNARLLGNHLDTPIQGYTHRWRLFDLNQMI